MKYDAQVLENEQRVLPRDFADEHPDQWFVIMDTENGTQQIARGAVPTEGMPPNDFKWSEFRFFEITEK